MENSKNYRLTNFQKLILIVEMSKMQTQAHLNTI